ncbi:hypothetical protein JH271_12450 [Xanthomonas campestris pv. campestris]|uniref:hypothetical protein n=2 Tax=Xanthomonas campestris TaxID=339 RepID=UPI00101AEB3C|nr:hypothetical protein [Xanthomonas campestris]MCD0248250.1 hypothetical protein [Xanthomonas campestris pv. campestris]MCD0252683.1 hypothetical protein [Xanthomonas campestris pv. campestris]MCD0268918.1 hypothetical protein [Xanthomonas campestris pv. campestris]MCD0275469.1 hypothetical protein [Xanthomonas campestris pv. campestris]MCF8803490.1 hypothetical protein [Xanthomonas campestris pv. campestris]
MCESNMEKIISRLDGLLSGLASFSGNIRDYSAYAFIAPLKDENSFEAAIKSHFNWLPNLEFCNIQVLQHGLRDLEVQIKPFLFREFRYGNTEETNKLQNYFSFRIMDDISTAIGGNKVTQVAKLAAIPEPQSSDSVFFCICMETNVIVIQFNDDINFIQSIKN